MGSRPKASVRLLGVRSLGRAAVTASEGISEELVDQVGQVGLDDFELSGRDRDVDRQIVDDSGLGAAPDAPRLWIAARRGKKRSDTRRYR